MPDLELPIHVVWPVSRRDQLELRDFGYDDEPYVIGVEAMQELYPPDERDFGETERMAALMPHFDALHSAGVNYAVLVLDHEDQTRAPYVSPDGNLINCNGVVRLFNGEMPTSDFLDIAQHIMTAHGYQVSAPV